MGATTLLPLRKKDGRKVVRLDRQIKEWAKNAARIERLNDCCFPCSLCLCLCCLCGVVFSWGKLTQAAVTVKPDSREPTGAYSYDVLFVSCNNIIFIILLKRKEKKFLSFLCTLCLSMNRFFSAILFRDLFVPFFRNINYNARVENIKSFLTRWMCCDLGVFSIPSFLPPLSLLSPL